jgi:hypothetical protein
MSPIARWPNRRAQPHPWRDPGPDYAVYGRYSSSKRLPPVLGDRQPRHLDPPPPRPHRPPLRFRQPVPYQGVEHRVREAMRQHHCFGGTERRVGHACCRGSLGRRRWIVVVCRCPLPCCPLLDSRQHWFRSCRDRRRDLLESLYFRFNCSGFDPCLLIRSLLSK